MAPVLIKLVVRFSSEDLVHGKVENLLRSQVEPSAGRWTCSKGDTSQRLEAEFQLEKPSYINHIDIGNYGSAFVEVFVGNSMWPPGKEFLSLLPSAMLMMPGDCKQWRQTTSVRMFHEESFNKRALKEKWDCVRVICRQPFRKDKQFGLSFIRFGTKDDEVKKTSVEDKNPSILNTSPPSTMKDKTLLSPRLKSSVSSKVESSDSPGGLSRGSKMLQAALDRKLKNPKPLTWSNDESFPDVNEDDSDDFGNQNPSVRDSRKPTSTYKRSNDEEINIFEAKKCKVHEPSEVDDSLWSSNEDIEDEVKCFLDGIDFTKIDLDTVTYSDLRCKMENQRGRKLSKREKKSFLKLVRDAVAHVLEHQDNDESEKADNASYFKQGKKDRSQELTVTRTTSHPTRKPRYDADENTCIADRSSPKIGEQDVEISTRVTNSSNSPSDKNNTVRLKEEQFTECPICGELFSSSVVEEHAATCISFPDSPSKDSKSGNENSISHVECPICLKHFPLERITEHADYCAETAGGFQDAEEVIAL